MLIKEILTRNPSTHPLANNGQARIATGSGSDKETAELRAELSTFVCTGQYADGIQRILTAFLADRNKTSQSAAWVSGFFGSGKSHLLKMLCHLWQNTSFPDGATARSLVTALPDEIQGLLRELDIAGKRAGGLLAAAGTMPSVSTENVRLSVLSILLRALGLPEQLPLARFCLWLEENGHLQFVRERVSDSGREWAGELNNLVVSPIIAKALLDCDPGFAPNEAEARKTLREQYSHPSQDLSTPEFLAIVKKVLARAGRDGKQPCTMLILDEVQLFIGDSENRSVLITEIAEAVAKQLDGQVMLVCAGQSALTGAPQLRKLMDRFTIRVQLSEADVEAVTRAVLLQKLPSAHPAIEAMLSSHAGEISRQLQGTKIGERIDDQKYIVEDYPLLPVRRRFWEHCFRQVDVAGTQSQLRSQLRILYDALVRQADKPLGALIAGDELYESLAAEMVNTGALPGEIRDRIIVVGQEGKFTSRLAQRVCGLVFLIGQSKLDSHADVGVRATKEHIADLLVDDLTADNGRLRNQVAELLEELAERGILMRVEEEYRIQTEEGRNWDQEFRNREIKLRNDPAHFEEQREALFAAEIDLAIREVNRKLVHGSAKVARRLVAFRSPEPPAGDGENIPVWIRDQFSTNERDLMVAARTAGAASPTLFVYILRKSRDELFNAIAAARAAEQTLAVRGVPGSEEGRHARQSMQSRLRRATEQRDALVREVVGEARVFQGGGSEALALTLEAKLREAAEASLVRMFPQFKQADLPSSAWEAVLKRATDGADSPFAPVKFEGPVEQHPVCQQLRVTIGSGKTGTQVRQELESSPYGWPRDAIDAALIAMHRSQHLAATFNGVPIPAGQIERAKFAKAEFRVERAPLTVEDRLKVRGLFQRLGITCKSGEELLKAPVFLQELLTLAKAAGGPPPLPEPPSSRQIEDLQRLTGNEQLAAICAAADDLQRNIADWQHRRHLTTERLPEWQTLQKLLGHTNGLSPLDVPMGDDRYLPEVRREAEAIRTQRLLLAPGNPIAPLKSRLVEELRNIVTDAHKVHGKAYAAGMEELVSSPVWNKVPEEQRARILIDARLKSPDNTGDVAVATEEALLTTLERCSPAARRAEADAIPLRVREALQLAAQVLEPKVQFIALEKSLLKNEAEVRQWAAQQTRRLIAALDHGPVQVQ